MGDRAQRGYPRRPGNGGRDHGQAPPGEQPRQARPRRGDGARSGQRGDHADQQGEDDIRDDGRQPHSHRMRHAAVLPVRPLAEPEPRYELHEQRVAV
jgi:hypothetical protein